jgi:hypothetical protein
MNMKKRFVKTLIATMLVATIPMNALASTISDVEKAKLRLEFAPAMTGEEVNYVPPMQSVTLYGAKVTGLDSCDGDISFAITNAFTDGTLAKIYENFEEILEEMVSTDALIYIASLYVQKANAGLYQLITNGISLSLDDFLAGMGSCESISAALVSQMPLPDLSTEATGMAKYNAMLSESASEMSDKFTDLDLTDYMKTGLDELAAETGFPWISDSSDDYDTTERGGDDDPVDFIGDVFKYGYCVYRGIEKDSCDTDTDVTETGNDQGQMQELLFETVEDVMYAAEQILGNKYISTCQGCETVEVKGAGIWPFMNETQAEIYAGLVTLASKTISNQTESEYDNLSAPPSVQLSAEYFRAFEIMESDEDVQEMFMAGYAFEVAYYRSLALLNTLELTVRDFKRIPAGKSLPIALDDLLSQVIHEKKRLADDVDAKGYTPLKYSKAILDVLDTKSVTTILKK